MLESVKAAWAWLALQNADLPWFAIGLTIFLTVYAVRKSAPGAWLWFESRSPFVIADPGAVGVVLHKAFQAIPSVLLGAALTALSTGGDLKSAALGALVGLVPPLTHELMAWLPFIPYKGAVSVPSKSLPILPLLLLCLMVGTQTGGCSSAAVTSAHVPCDASDHVAQLDLAEHAAACRVRVQACDADQDCRSAVIAECDAYGDARCSEK